VKRSGENDGNGQDLIGAGIGIDMSDRQHEKRLAVL